MTDFVITTLQGEISREEFIKRGMIMKTSTFFKSIKLIEKC